MEQMDGLELAASLRKQQNKTAIIFISVNRELALYGYEVAAARYLAKPLDKERLKEALLYCYRNRQEDKEILLPTVMGQRRISVSDIQYIEAFERGTRVVLLEESEESRCKFSEMKEMLPEHLFLQCHRSYAVNLSCVKIIRRYDFILKSGLTVPISKNRFLEVYQLFADYIAD